VPESYRRGLELSFLAKATSRIELGYNGTISQNKIVNFTESVDNWDTGTQDEVEHTNRNIAYSPSQLHTVITRWGLSPKGAKHNFALQANFKYVGEQYLDNTQSEFAKLDAFSYLDMMLNYKTKFWKLRDFAVNLQVNNVLNQKFVSNGWVYRFRTNEPSLVTGDPQLVTEGTGRYNLTGVFPQATINFLLGVTAKF
jgi:iron complex outermembrane receptor protein